MNTLILPHLENEKDRTSVLGAYDLFTLEPLNGRERPKIVGLDQDRVFGDYIVVVLNPDYLEQQQELNELEFQIQTLQEQLTSADAGSEELSKRLSELQTAAETLRRRLVKTWEDISFRLAYKIVENRLDLDQINDLTFADVQHLAGVPTYLVKNLPPFSLRSVQEAVVKSGYTPAECSEDHLMNNIDPLIPNREIFFVPVEYVLDGPSLVVRIPAREIEYPVGIVDKIGQKYSYPLLNINLLEYFGAADTDSEGYIFVPDGSGALIYLNNGRQFGSAYNQPVFGRDNALNVPDEIRSFPEPVRLPVFGLKQDDKAFFAIIEDGASLARVKADVSGRVDNYNRVWTEFTLLPSERLSLNVSGFGQMPVYQARPYPGDFTIRFLFLSGEEASYSGMARRYREYLIEKHGLKRVEADGPIPFYLELLAAVDKKEPILGIARDVIHPLTTIGQAQAVVSEFAAAGVGNIALKYNGWLKGGVSHEYPLKASMEKTVGSAAQLRQLGQYMEQQGYALYPSVSLVNVYRDSMFDGFNPKKDASRLLNRLEAKVFDYRLDVFDRIMDEYHYVLSPRKVKGLVDSFLANYIGKYGLDTLSIVDMGRDLNSDFSDDPRRVIDREESLSITLAELENMKKLGMKLLLDGGNSYAIPYAAALVNVPDRSSRFTITNQEVPFYQMVIHGLVSYAGQPVNLAADKQATFLKLLETGGSPYFILTGSQSFELKDTAYNEYFSSYYRDWLEYAAAVYEQANAVLADVQDQFIVEHRVLADRVYQTVYESGKSVIVNYNKEAVAVAGHVIEGEGYLVVEETVYDN